VAKGPSWVKYKLVGPTMTLNKGAYYDFDLGEKCAYWREHRPIGSI